MSPCAPEFLADVGADESGCLSGISPKDLPEDEVGGKVGVAELKRHKKRILRAALVTVAKMFTKMHRKYEIIHKK